MILRDVRVRELYFEGPSLPYVEVDTGKEILKIRIRHGSVAIEWFKDNRDKVMDLLISPKPWMVGDKSGVVNYFKCAVLKDPETPN